MKTIVVEGKDLLNLKLNAKDVKFKKEVAAKMKELGYDTYAKFTYRGIMFTSNEKGFLNDVESGDIAFIELEETLLEAEDGTMTKPGYNVIGYHNYTQLNRLEEIEATRKEREFRVSLCDFDKLVKNPELLSRLDLIEKIANASS